MMLTGIVAKVIFNKGFGFITPKDKEQEDAADLFFHASATVPRELFDTLEAGAAVKYDICAETKDGRPRAVNVRSASA